MAENIMEFKKNEELAEKPDHLHYPICRGRLEAINNISTDILRVTIGTSVILAVLSLVGIPFHVVGWIPMMLTTEDMHIGMNGGFAILQTVICLIPIAFAAFGCTERKIFDLILFFYYALMLLFSVIIHLTIFDSLTFLAGLVGVLKSFRMIKGYPDFKQLKKTEGYPIFSVTLAEYDDRKKNSPDGYYRDHYDELVRQRLIQQRQGAQPADINSKRGITAFSQPQSETTGGLGDMPELNVSKPELKKAAPDRFVTKAGKESKVLFSDLKLR